MALIYPMSKTAAFTATHWTTVLAAGQPDSSRAAEALAALCHRYWYPLYAFVRRNGFDEHEAQDMTQEFFARLLEKNWLQSVDRQKGRFRSWLLAALDHFLANEWARRKTEKRGGQATFLPLDAASAETRYLLEPVDEQTPEKIYERRWALTLLEQSLAALKAEYSTEGKAEQFDAMQVHLSGERGPNAYAESAARLGMTEGAVRVGVHRMRRRMGESLRAEIAHTVADASEVEGELKHLLAVLAG
jgi:RNA polymerase sigma factor (sigma-70 family)